MVGAGPGMVREWGNVFVVEVLMPCRTQTWRAFFCDKVCGLRMRKMCMTGTDIIYVTFGRENEWGSGQNSSLGFEHTCMTLARSLCGQLDMFAEVVLLVYSTRGHSINTEKVIVCGLFH